MTRAGQAGTWREKERALSKLPQYRTEAGQKLTAAHDALDVTKIVTKRRKRLN